jgi:hypothetical protein
MLEAKSREPMSIEAQSILQSMLVLQHVVNRITMIMHWILLTAVMTKVLNHMQGLVFLVDWMVPKFQMEKT